MGRFLNLRQFLKSFIKQKPFKRDETIKLIKHKERVTNFVKKEFGKNDIENQEDWIY